MEKYISDYYQVFDSDDILLPCSTRKMMSFMQKEKADIVSGQYIFIDKHGNKFDRFSHWRPYNANYAYKIKRDQHISRSGMIWKRSVIEKVGKFNGSLIGVADWDFAIRCLEKNIRVRNVNFPIAKVRIHEKSVTNSHFFGKINSQFKKDALSIRKKYPMYYHVEFRYLDFFKKEFEQLFPFHNRKLEEQILDYIEKLIFENRIKCIHRTITFVKKLSGDNYRKHYLLALLFVKDKKNLKAKKYINKILKIKKIKSIEIYRIASFCEKHKDYNNAKILFGLLLRKRNISSEMRAGVWFHKGCIFDNERQTDRALKSYLTCLAFNKNHSQCKKLLISLRHNPKVSVIMAVRNQSRYISASINSILNQTFQNFEIVIVDDTSNQKTARILELYCKKDRRIRVFRNKRCIGLTKSLNKAISFTKGEFIARQDGDDISVRTRLAKQLEFLNTHPSISIVGTYYIRWEEKENRRVKVKLPISHEGIIAMLKRPETAMTTIIAKGKDLKKIGGYNEKMYFSQDYELYLRASKRYRLANIPQYLSILRYHGKNNSIKYEQKMKAAVQWALSGNVDYKPFGHFYRSWRIKKSKEKRLCAFFERGNYNAVVKCFDRSFRIYTLICPGILYRVASAAKRIKKYKKAFNLFNKIITMNHADISYRGGAYFHLGELCLLKMYNKHAIKYFRKCINIIPKHRASQKYIKKLI